MDTWISSKRGVIREPLIYAAYCIYICLFIHILRPLEFVLNYSYIHRYAKRLKDIINPVASASITTEKSFSFTFGTVEIRAKMPKGDWISTGQ